MYLKIYFDDKPLFLCDQVTPDIEPYAHHDDAVLIDEFSAHAINAMIHEMHQEKIHAGLLVHHDLEALKKAFFRKFDVIRAAGGLVFNEEKEALFIFRRGKWDLPKGKLDEGETLEECAVREVEEETGLRQVILKEYLLTTYHTYNESGKHILKESYWYKMEVKGKQQLVPQTEEDITKIEWVKKEDWNRLTENSFALIKDILKAADSSYA